MRILVPMQSPDEHRVPLTPVVAERLVGAGHAVSVTEGAGRRAGFEDDEYRRRGATLVGPSEGWDADLVVSVGRPGHPVTGGLLGLLEPFTDPGGLAELAAPGGTLFAFEAVPRSTRAQMVDALSSQATAAGYQAVLEGACASNRLFPLMTTAAGTIRPARVLVLGAGVAGLQAIATARRLGAVVSAFDVRSAAVEQVESLGARFVSVDMEAQDASRSGGYAREVDEDAQARIIAGLAPYLAEADVVIATAAIPGKRAPLLVDDASLAGMPPGAVIVDVSAATGGNTSRTVPGATVAHGGVEIIGTLRLESKVAADASRMYARNVAAFVELLSGDDGGFDPHWDDDIVSETCVARGGELVHPIPAPEER
jgi:H+-translocating NAD(P) transhydrogenase subunit alpha